MPAILLKASKSLWHHPSQGGKHEKDRNLICITSAAQSSRATRAPAASCQVDKTLRKLCWFLSLRVWARGAIIRVSLSFQEPELQAAKLQQNQSCFAHFYARIPTSPENRTKCDPAHREFLQVKTFMFYFLPN